MAVRASEDHKMTLLVWIALSASVLVSAILWSIFGVDVPTM
jgi:hypothetical protein